MRDGKTNFGIRTFLKSSLMRQCGLVLGALALLSAGAIAQTAPNFGPNVYIFDPSMSSATIQSTLNSLNTEAQFSSNRYAVFFMPGTYSGIAAEVGYYESVAGLGLNPQSVVINGELMSNQTDSNGNLTTNFWRSLENLDINYSGTLQWGVSQGADFRRMYINGPLQLTNTNCGQASGGFIADSVITGNVNPCSQQQWYTRNSSLGSWSGGVWNMVFSGVQGAPTPNYPTKSYTVLPTTPASREKPFLYVDGSGNYNVFVPAAQTNSSGTTWSRGNAPGYSVPIGQFFIAQPSTPLADINTALAYGQNLILTPGIYQYSGAITITNPNTIVLGLGFATLIPQAGTPAITIPDVDGVQIAGIIIDAGPVNSPVLLQVGAQGLTGVSHESNPTTINDVFFRIGGATAGLASTSLEVDSNNVILDNIWAWRADHGNGIGWNVNVANNGVVVNGDNVLALGLAVEHYQQNQVLWNGNGGETIFYQSELPYDVPSQSAWMNGSANGYSSYAVSSSVTTHAAYGVGVYSYFNQGVSIVEDSAITVPDAVGVTVTDAVSVFLAGSGQITSTVNNAGKVAKSGSITSYLSFYQGVACTTTCPESPSNLYATTISPSQINLTWTPSSTASVLYNVFRSTTAGFTPSSANQIATGLTAASYPDTTVQPLSTYYYVVEASGMAGPSAASNQSSATTPATGGLITTDVLRIDSAYSSTAPPTGWVDDEYYSGSGTASSVTHAITIPSSVTHPAPAAVYQSYRHGSSFTYTIPGMTPGGSYIVDLHFAEDYSGASAGYRKFNVAINSSPVLKNFDIFAAAGGLYIANVQSFYAVADASGTITIQFTTGSANSPQVNGVEIGQGTIPVPAAPTSANASAVSVGQINISWNASTTSGVQYEVFRSTTPGFTPSPNNLLTTTSATAYSDTSVLPSTTYYYVVHANNSVLTSLPSNQAATTSDSVAVAPPSAPVPPTALVSSAVSSHQINLLWIGSATPSVQYQLFRSTTAQFTPSSSNLVTTTTATGYLDDGLTGSTTYYYAVEATNTNGTSAPSNQTSATTSMATPASIVAVSGSGQTSQAGTSFTSPLVVSVQDTYGNPVSNATVTFSGAGVSFPSGSTALTDASGQAQVTAQPTTSGPLTISASVDGVSTPASFAETGTAVPQTITFKPLMSPVTYGVAPLTLNGSATSGLTVIFSVLSGPGSIRDNALTVNGAGTIVVAADQAGDSSNSAAPEVTQTILVNPAAVTIPWPTPAPITYGTALGAAQLNATASVPGTFSYSPASGVLPAGQHLISVTFTPSDTTDYTQSTASVTLMVNPAVLTVAAVNASQPFGATPVLSATISGYVNGDTSSQVSGAPSLTTTANSSSQPGTYPIIVGPGTLSAANYTFNLIGGTDTVTGVDPVSLQISNTLLTYPGAANITVCVAPAGKSTATGTVGIYDGAMLLTTQSLQGGGCAYWYISPGLNAGTHALKAVYSGDRNNPSAASAVTAVTVNPVPVNMSVSCWNASFAYGANYQCTLNVSFNGGAAQGAVTYSFDGGSASTVALNSGSAQFTISTPAAGNHRLVVAYAQQTNFAAATSQTESFTVTPAPVNVALTPSTYYAKAGTRVSFAAAVTSWSAGAPNSTGSVSFYDGATLLGAVPVDASGRATLATSNLSAATHTITATYAGGQNYASGSSTATITLAQ